MVVTRAASRLADNGIRRLLTMRLMTLGLLTSVNFINHRQIGSHS